MNTHETQVRDLAAQLRAEGHLDAARRVETALEQPGLGDTLLTTLRDACQFVLTAIEALDPKTQLMAEELRLSVDAHLRR